MRAKSPNLPCRRGEDDEPVLGRIMPISTIMLIKNGFLIICCTDIACYAPIFFIIPIFAADEAKYCDITDNRLFVGFIWPRNKIPLNQRSLNSGIFLLIFTEEVKIPFDTVFSFFNQYRLADKVFSSECHPWQLRLAILPVKLFRQDHRSR